MRSLKVELSESNDGNGAVEFGAGAGSNTKGAGAFGAGAGSKAKGAGAIEAENIFRTCAISFTFYIIFHFFTFDFSS